MTNAHQTDSAPDGDEAQEDHASPAGREPALTGTTESPLSDRGVELAGGKEGEAVGHTVGDAPDAPLDIGTTIGTHPEVQPGLPELPMHSDRSAIIWAHPEAVLDRIDAALAAESRYEVRRVQMFSDPPALLIQCRGVIGDFHAIRQIGEEAGAAHVRTLGWTSAKDLTIIGRGAGPERLQDFRRHLADEGVAVCLLLVSRDVVLNDYLFAWVAPPEGS